MRAVTASVVAVLSGQAGSGKVVCGVSGGNIDAVILTKMLEGEMP
jgi:threonine dehydratase